MRVDLPEPPEWRPVIVGGDVLARDVEAVGRPGANALLVGPRRRRLRLGKLGEASAVSLVMFAMLLLFTLVYVRIAMRQEER